MILVTAAALKTSRVVVTVAEVPQMVVVNQQTWYQHCLGLFSWLDWGLGTNPKSDKHFMVVTD